MPLPPLNPSLGNQVTSRQFSLAEMVERSWGSEFRAPDHRVYVFSNGRGFDSTDMGTTGIYRRGITPGPSQIVSGEITTDYGSGITTDGGSPIIRDPGGPPSPSSVSSNASVSSNSPVG